MSDTDEELMHKDYLIEYSINRSEIARDDKDPTRILQKISQELDCFNDLDPAHANYMLNTVIPIFTKILLKRRYSHIPSQVHIHVNEFFKSIIRFIIQHLEKDTCQLLLVLKRLFDSNKDFFDQRFCMHSHDLEERVWEDRESETESQEGVEGLRDTEYADIRSQLYVNILHPYLVNYFGIQGGFVKIVNFINTCPPLDQIGTIVYIFTQLKDTMHLDPWKTTGKAVAEACLSLTSHLKAEDMHVTSKEALVYCIKHFEDLLDSLYSTSAKVGKVLEPFEIEIYLLFLKCPYLEKRINGLSMITEMWAKAKAKDQQDHRYTRGDFYCSYYEDTSRWMTMDFMVTWMEKNCIIEILFGEGAHNELIKRSVELIKSMYKFGKFGIEQLDTIWQSQIGKHETDRTVIFDLLSEILDVLTLDDLHHLFCRVKEIPLAEIDVQVVNFIKQLTIKGTFAKAPTSHPVQSIIPSVAIIDEHSNLVEMQHFEEKQEESIFNLIGHHTEELKVTCVQYEIEDKQASEAIEPSFEISETLDYLWSLWQDSAATCGIASAVGNMALQHFGSTLCYYYPENRSKYLHSCIENIRLNECVLYSMQMLQQILSSFQGHHDKSKSEILEQLESEHGLTKEVFRNLIQFKHGTTIELMQVEGNTVEETRSTCSSGDESVNLSYSEQLRSLSVSGQSYIDQIKERLNFIQFIYSHSNTTMTERHMKILWECLIMNAFDEEEQDIFYSWLSDLLNNRSFESNALEEEFIHHIFIDYLVKLEPRTLSKQAFQCLQTFFINVNYQHGMISKLTLSGEFRVTDIKLLGINIFWDIILLARRSEVVTDATNFLMKIYSSLCTKDDKLIYEDFLENCMKNVASGAQLLPGSERDGVKKISRTMEILNLFLDKFENVETFNPPVQFQGEPIGIVIKPTGAGLEDDEFPLTLYTRMTLKEARKQIGKALTPQKESYELTMVAGGRLLKSEDTTIEEFNTLREGQKVLVTSNFEAESDTLLDMQPNYEPSSDKIETLKGIFEDTDTKILEIALNKANGFIEEAVNLLSDEFYMKDIMEEFEATKVKKELPSAIQNIKLSQMLSDSDSHFDLLFSLLEFGNSQIAQSVWGLIEKIPTNSRIFSQIKTLDWDPCDATINWETLFDPDNQYKLLYSLQIVRDIIFAPSQNETWTNEFIIFGGFEHLVKILLAKNFNDIVKVEPAIKSIEILLKVLDRLFDEAIREQVLSATQIQLDAIMHKLLEIIEAAFATASNEVIVAECFNLMLPLIKADEAQVLIIFQKENLETLITTVLLKSPNQFLRESVKTAVLSLTQNVSDQYDSTQIFMQILLNHLPNVTDTSNSTGQFYELVWELCQEKHVEQLKEYAIEFLNQREIIEERGTSVEDVNLTGCLKILTHIMKWNNIDPNELSALVDILYDALFAMPEIGNTQSNKIPPICKSNTLRKAAYDLLMVLITESQQNCENLLQNLRGNHMVNKQDINYDIDIGERMDYVGLKNFGSTCYMNALMQQLFMMPSLREEILETPVHIEPEEKITDNLLFQLQQIFSNLSESEKQYYGPMEFCQAFKDWDGNPMNVRIQQDADEFFNLFCDKIETCLKSSNREKLLRNYLGGVLSQEIISTEEEYPYTSERTESFMRISLDIKNKATLSEALDLFITEDNLDGDNRYHCEKYDKKINAVKKCSIKHLANTVIIHLKRFEFDFTNMQRFKMNSYFEFPHELDLQPWCKPHPDQDEDYYKYKLVGVLVHSGVADSGHYYSFICNRGTDKWFKFDDIHISSFDPENLKNECFGGAATANEYTAFTGQLYELCRNAYMLFYERQHPIAVEAQTPHKQDESLMKMKDILSKKIWDENSQFHRNRLFYDESYSILMQHLVSQISFPEKRYSDVQDYMSDTKHLRELRYYTAIVNREIELTDENAQTTEQGLQNWADEIEKIEVKDQGLQVLKMSTNYTYELLTVAQNLSAFQSWCSILMHLFTKHIPACLWFVKYLTENLSIVKEILLDLKEETIRESFAELIIKVLGESCLAEARYLSEKQMLINLKYYQSRQSDSYGINTESKEELIPISASMRFIKAYCLDLLKFARISWKKYKQYFWIFLRICEMGPRQRSFLIEQNVIKKLIKFFMNGSYPYYLDNSFEKMGDTIQDPDFSVVLKILHCLVRNSITLSMESSGNRPTYMNDKAINVPTHLLAQFSERAVIREFLESSEFDTINEIYLHLCYADIRRSRAFMEELSSVATNFTAYSNNASLRYLSNILQFQDGYEEERLSTFLNLEPQRTYMSMQSFRFFDHVYRMRDMYLMACLRILLWWGDMTSCQHIRQHITDNSGSYFWILSHLKGTARRTLVHEYVQIYTGDSVRIRTAVAEAIEIFEKLVQYEEPPSMSDQEEPRDSTTEGEEEHPSTTMTHEEPVMSDQEERRDSTTEGEEEDVLDEKEANILISDSAGEEERTDENN